MKKIVFPIPLLLLSMAFADGTSVDFADPSTTTSVSKDETCSQNPLNTQMYNLQARPVVKNSCDFWIMGEALLWQAIEEKLTYVYSGTPLGSIPNNHDLRTLDFDWDWGYRVGAGYNLDRDGWDVAGYYTHAHNNAHASKHARSNESLIQSISSLSEILPPPLASARAKWHIDLDQADLQLGREAYIGKHLTLRPFVGMRSTWLFQEYDVTYVNAASTQQKAHLSNQFWGYGFTFGMDTDWLFKKGFSLYANADYSLLLGFFKIREKGHQEETLLWNLKNSFRTGRSIFDIALGLKWSGLFCKDRYGLTLKSGYEYHMYFNQNQFTGNKVAISSALDHYSTQGGNLIYQGVVGSVQFDF